MALVSIQEIIDAQTSARLVAQDLKMAMESMDAYNREDDPEDVNMIGVANDIKATLLKIEIVNKFFSKIVTKTLLKIGE